MGDVRRARRCKARLARRLKRELTLAETRLWERLRHGAIGAPIRRQHPIGPFVADFYCHASRLDIEVDGPVHDTTVERDAHRDALMIAHGLEVIRFANDQVLGEPDAVLDVLAAANERRVAQVRSANTPTPCPSPAAAGEGNQDPHPLPLPRCGGRGVCPSPPLTPLRRPPPSHTKKEEAVPTLATLRAALRLDLNDPAGASARWTDADPDRAI